MEIRFFMQIMRWLLIAWLAVVRGICMKAVKLLVDICGCSLSFTKDKAEMLKHAQSLVYKLKHVCIYVFMTSIFAYAILFYLALFLEAIVEMMKRASCV